MPDDRLRRRPLVIGNWKMHQTGSEGADLARAVVAGLAGARAEVALAPPFTALAAVAEALAGSAVGLVGQDAFFENEGAFTGAISAPMLRDAGCSRVLVGHSERRRHFGDSDAVVRKKTAAVLAAGMDPVLCVGETAADRDAGRAAAVVESQLAAGFASVPDPGASRLVVAYEPVWAIGAGRTATPEVAEAMHRTIRARIATLWGDPAASAAALLYGGSVTGDNAAAILAGEQVDGVLVGGASLRADSFLAICRAAARTALPPDCGTRS